MLKKTIILLSFIAIAAVGYVYVQDDDTATNPAPVASQPAQQQTEQPEPEPQPTRPSPSNDPANPLVIVNKLNGISPDYVPADLRVPDVLLRLDPVNEQMSANDITATATEAMFAAASTDGVQLVFGSGYRSAALQSQFYNAYVAADGQAAADTYSARPGHSEHQTGFAVDVTAADGSCHLEACFEDTAEGQWLAANAQRFGFIIRYLKDHQDITGYTYEPWHLRYVGAEVAAEVYAGELTLEEYFGLPAAGDYAG